MTRSSQHEGHSEGDARTCIREARRSKRVGEAGSDEARLTEGGGGKRDVAVENYYSHQLLSNLHSVAAVGVSLSQLPAYNYAEMMSSHHIWDEIQNNDETTTPASRTNQTLRGDDISNTGEKTRQRYETTIYASMTSSGQLLHNVLAYGAEWVKLVLWGINMYM